MAEGQESAGRRRRRAMDPLTRTIARGMFYTHLWLGVLITILVLSLSVTGILLNHKKTLGFQPSAENEAPAPLASSLPLAELEARARAVDVELAEVPIDRMDVRPVDGVVKLRFDDAITTEVILALDDGRVLSHSSRGDVFLERLHSGELFGDGWILLSDAAAAGLVLLTISGIWLWLFPRWRH